MAAKYLADHLDGECLHPVGDAPANGDMSRQLYCCEPVANRRARFCPAHQSTAVKREAKK